MDKPNKIAKPFVIFEIANNHFGSVSHGKRIISEFSKFIKFDFCDFGIKFQYRDLENLIHEDYKNDISYPYIKRFNETRLTDIQFLELKNFALEMGFITVCTPFDEISVNKVIQHTYDYIKIASASLTDWPLLESIASTGKPIIASTAGASSIDLRRSVSFLKKRVENLTLMHCVAKYPTLDKDLHLDRIDFIKANFKDLRVGYSSHENPDNFQAVAMAYAKGARVFEKHVGVEFDSLRNNLYSCTPSQIARWLESLEQAVHFCDYSNTVTDEIEVSTLNSLRRGIYAKQDLTAGTTLNSENIYFAIPTHENQLLANDWSKLVRWDLQEEVRKNQPIFKSFVSKESKGERIEEIAFRAKNMCNEAGVTLPNMINFEVSHHYGINSFEKFGMVLVTVINRDYCKKILILMPGQTNPEHHHKIKEESFFCVYGDIEITVDGKISHLVPGEIAVIPRGKKHVIFSRNGAVVEEISSSSLASDSYYSDSEIHNNKDRKSNIVVWS